MHDESKRDDLDAGVDLEKDKKQATPRGPLDKGGEHPVRRHFRVPADPDEVSRIVVNGVEFPVFDVSEGGICHLIAKDKAFDLGQDPGPIEVVIQGKTMTLEGMVVHMTPHKEDKVRCGIMFTAVGPEQLEIIKQYVEEIRSIMFED
ncbi:MAG: PilZ domain-containing protein [Desulfovibrio sp.]|nr:MAG: PilZ domain-containing protein [Desulfovibrio sp.]